MNLAGRKDDVGKAPWDLVPWDAMTEVVRVLEHGATRYGAHNWRRVLRAQDRYFAAALRHLLAHRRGELLDEDSGRAHLAHAAACVLFMLALSVAEGES